MNFGAEPLVDPFGLHTCCAVGKPLVEIFEEAETVTVLLYREVITSARTYEEKWSQWFLERSFFRDFVYRNPRGKKKGQELADGVVLFDDVALMVQVKAQCGRHDPMSWATEKLLEAFKQLCKTHQSLVDGHIKKLKNDFYGNVEFDPNRYPNRIGLIILAHNSAPYIAAKLEPEILTAGFPDIARL